MKKFLSIIFALTLTLGIFGSFDNEAEAATTLKSTATNLTTSQTSKSTVRVIANQHLTSNVYNAGQYKVTYRIFKNGVAQTGYISVAPGARGNNKVYGGGEYSLRMYCGSSSGTGCSASAGLVGF